MSGNDLGDNSRARMARKLWRLRWKVRGKLADSPNKLMSPYIGPRHFFGSSESLPGLGSPYHL